MQPGASPGEFQIDPKAFGTFGIRLYRSAAPLGLEHTVAYSPKFLDTGGRAFLYSTNLRMEFRTGRFRPYATLVGASFMAAATGLPASDRNTVSTMGPG